jgi:SAM-dependent methyltransferase
MLDVLTFNNREYLKIQELGFASQYAFPFARHFCKGTGYDIGCGSIKWSFPDSIPIDSKIVRKIEGREVFYSAYNLPMKEYGSVDYIFSSHCLEHLDDWVFALDYWIKNIRSGGVLFLYLPHYDQEYWRPYNNKKHIHTFTPVIIEDYFKQNKNIFKYFVSERDLLYSFMAVAEITHN